jgi:hypothetical protein
MRYLEHDMVAPLDCTGAESVRGWHNGRLDNDPKTGAGQKLCPDHMAVK